MPAKSGKKKADYSPQIVNKKAFRDYEILEKLEVGIALAGTEVKSLRDRQADLKGSYARVESGECWLVGCKIARYPQAAAANHEPHRTRKLLLHKRQINKIIGKLEQRGFTLVPLRLYFNHRGFAKLELALARGKKQYDKRKQIQKREQRKDIDRALKRYRKK